MKDEASYTCDSCGEEVVVPFDGSSVGVGLRVQQSCAPLPICEEEGEGASRQFSHDAPVPPLIGSAAPASVPPPAERGNE